MSLSVPSNGLPLRRNGKPQSCEPCRKAKSACDHELPTCRRCVRRGIATRCTYHPAPLTRITVSLLDGSRVQKKDNAPNAVTTKSQGPNAVSNLLFLANQRCERSEVPKAPLSEFLGPTSYSAIFCENQANIGEDLLSTHQEDEITPDFPGEQEDWWMPERQSLGSGILKHFPDQQTCERLLNRHEASCDVELHMPSMRYSLASLWSTFGEVLTEPRHPDQIMAMTKILIRNSASNVTPGRTSEEWLESFTGPRLRWEVIGTFFAVFGLSVMTLPDWATYSKVEDSGQDDIVKDKRKYVRKMSECAEGCLLLSADNESVNEFVVWLMHHIHMLNSFYSGDASKQIWRRHGALASAITTLGLHRGSDITNSPSFMVAELRKRIFSSAFAQDKQLATLTGRPPALSRRYSNVQLPLDLSDEDLVADEETLKVAISRLDADGWNTEAGKSPVTICRAWMLMALIRDEILEISLGPACESGHLRRDDIKRRSEETYASLPAHIRFQPSSSSSPQSPILFISQINLSLEFLLNRFLLERLPDADSQQDKQNLLNTAKEMLDRIILLSANRDRLVDHQVGFAWAIVYFGIPSAGVLAVELLKQSKYPQHYPLILPRSEVVQNLSIFIGCLGSIRPTQGNYTLCGRMRKVIRRILDRVLEPALSVDAMLTPPSSVSLEMPGWVPDIDIPSVMGPTDDPDFAEWLSSVDWTRGPWVDSY